MNENTTENSVPGRDKNRASPSNLDVSDKPQAASGAVSRSRIALYLTAFFVALAWVGFGLWIWLKAYHDISTVMDSTQRLSKRVEELNLKPELSRIMNRFDSETTTLSDHLAEQNKAIESLRQSVTKLFAEAARTPSQWTMARSFHLVELANYRLQFLRDIETAAIALQTAHQVLETSADPSLLHVRKAISEDLTKLKSFKRPNLNVIEEKLDQLLKEHRYMPLVKPDTSKGDKIMFQVSNHSSAETQESQNILHTLLEEINKHLIVKRHDKPIDALPSQQSQIYYYQILHLKLESIRLAVLKADNEEYQQQLSSTLDWIGSYYTPSSVQAIKEELEKLAAINIAPALPTITDSLEALRNILDTATLHVQEGAME